MIFETPDLVRDERILYRKGSNFIASLKEADLDRFCADKLMWTIGMKGKEAIGGHLYITNFRLIFVAHKMNRLKGQFSIPLFQIEATRRSVRFPMYRLIVTARNGEYRFVSWSVRKAMRVIDENKGNRSPDLDAEMAAVLEKNQALCFVNTLFISKDRMKDFWNKTRDDG